jgi:hypothetical protein
MGDCELVGRIRLSAEFLAAPNVVLVAFATS